MKIFRKVSIGLTLLVVFGSVSLALLLLHCMRLFFLEGGTPAVFWLTVGAVLAVCLAGGGWLLYWLFRVIGPVCRAAEFAGRLAAGENPAPLKVNPRGNDELNALLTSLNFLHDRQQILGNKLKLSIAREAKIRREIDRHDLLQLSIMNRMLPEVRSPLGILKGYLRLARYEAEKVPGNDETIRLIEKAGSRIGMIARQIEQMIDIGRLGRDCWSKLELTSFDTSGFLREQMELNQLQLRSREITLLSRLSASAPARLLADRELLRQLVMILVRAVARASSPGETVVLSCFGEGGKVVFEVHDSRLRRCREPLAERFRLHAAGEPSPIGEAGLNTLGLLFVRDIARRTGGGLTVSESSGANNVLRLEFDARDLAPEAGSHHGSSGEVRREAPLLRGEEFLDELDGGMDGPLEPIRVLLGSEYPESHEILTRLLAIRAIEITAVDTPEAMVKAAGAEHFDGFLVGGSFRSGNFELIGKLRAAAGRRDLPVVVASTFFDDEDRRRLSEMDRVYPMELPLNYELLAQVLRRAAGAGR